ncbi:hypothetical protein [Nocardia salmonicida]|uniref:hypothetical protein n=1 Tax=Nocardia salmonicida TaxID=53431 RepID=UPI000A7852BE|nr:hypothetical protein [Nocardia salmonicida]
MSHLSSTAHADDVVAEYIAAHPFTSRSGRVYDMKASVRLTLNADTYVTLDIEHVRYLAEVLPGLVMAHDTAEHDKAVVTAAAEIDSAHKAA